MIKINKPKAVNYNQLRGSGLFPVPDPICKAESCQATNTNGIQPVTYSRPKPVMTNPLIATKTGLDDNHWELNGTIYQTFNQLWVNIPKQKYTVLKVYGRTG